MQKKAINQLTREDILGLSITHKSVIPPIEPVITVAGSNFAIKSGISLVTGKTGSGKTTILRVMLSLILADKNKPLTFDCLSMQATPANGRYVIYLNTEVSDSQVKKDIHDAVLKDLSIKETPENFRTISIVNYNPEERREFISRLFLTVPDIFLLILDGGADTVYSVNDDKESNAAIEELNQLALQYKTTVINVVHENKGNGLTRGHYGQNFERKATGLMSVRFDKAQKTFIMTGGKSRGTPSFEDVYFRYDERGNLYQHQREAAAQFKAEAREDDFKTLVLECFADREIWNRADLVKHIAALEEVDQRNAQIRVRKMIDRAYITVEGTKHVRCLLPINRSVKQVLV